MTILALDPGSEVTGWVLFDEVADREGRKPILDHGIDSNEATIHLLRAHIGIAKFVTEFMEPSHLPVSREAFETVFWTGRFAEALMPTPLERIARREVKLHLLGQLRGANDAAIRAALVARYGTLAAPAIGTKRAPGPLYGIRSHEWAALAVAVTWADRDRAAVAAAVDAGVMRVVGRVHDRMMSLAETGLEREETRRT